MAWPVAGVTTAVNVACWPASGGFGAALIETIVGALTLDTVTISCRVDVAPPESVTVSVTVYVPGAVNTWVTTAPVAVSPSPKLQRYVQALPHVVPSSA